MPSILVDTEVLFLNQTLKVTRIELCFLGPPQGMPSDVGNYRPMYPPHLKQELNRPLHEDSRSQQMPMQGVFRVFQPLF